MALGGASSSGPSVLGAIARHRVLVLTSVVISIALAILLGAFFSGSPREVAVASLVVSGGTGSEIGVTDRPERFVANQVEVIRSSRVTQRALQLLHDDGIVDVSVADLQDNLLIVDQENSDQIVVSYADQEGSVALAVVNAVLEAYRDIRRELTDVVADEAVDRVDAELELLDQRLAGFSAGIEALESSNALAEDLETQAADAVTRIGVLQAELDSSADPERRNQIIDQLADLRARVDLFLNMQSASRSGPELQSLLASQESAIERRAALVLSRDQILIDTALTPSVVAFEDPAVLAPQGTGITGWRAVAVGLIVGLVVGTSIAVAKSGRHFPIEDRDEVVEILNAPSWPAFQTSRPSD